MEMQTRSTFNGKLLLATLLLCATEHTHSDGAYSVGKITLLAVELRRRWKTAQDTSSMGESYSKSYIHIHAHLLVSYCKGQSLTQKERKSATNEKVTENNMRRMKKNKSKGNFHFNLPALRESTCSPREREK